MLLRKGDVKKFIPKKEDLWFEQQNDRLLRMPSPDPSSFGEPQFTWGEIVGKPVQIGGKRFYFDLEKEREILKLYEKKELPGPTTDSMSVVSKKDNYEFLVQRSSKEEIMHEMSNKILREKNNGVKERNKKIDQVRNMLTPRTGSQMRMGTNVVTPMSSYMQSPSWGSRLGQGVGIFPEKLKKI